MKKIIPVLVVLVLVGFLISGCSTPVTDNSDVFDSQLGIDDIGNELAILDADNLAYDLSDLDDIENDLSDL